MQQANKMRPVAGGFSHTDGEAVSGSLGLSPFDLVPAFNLASPRQDSEFFGGD